jgi:chromosome segregation ATPase
MKRCAFLANEAQDFRRQLKQANDELENRIEEVTFSLSASVQEEGARSADADGPLWMLKRELKNSENGGETAVKFLEIISVGSVEDATVAALERRTEVLKSEGDAILENVSRLQVRLRQRKAQLKEVSDAGNERNLKIWQFENDVEDLRSQNAALQAEVAKFTESDPELRTAVEKQGELIRMNQTDHERTIAAIQEECELSVAENAAEIDDAQRQIGDIEMQTEEEKQSIQWELKKEIKKVNNEQ